MNSKQARKKKEKGEDECNRNKYSKEVALPTLRWEFV